MKNKSVFLVIIIGLAIAAYFIGGSMTGTPEVTVDTTESEMTVAQKPDRKSEIYGKVSKMEGNLLTIVQIDVSADPTAEMTTAEKQAYKQALSEEERMALKEASLNATLGEVTVVVPVGIPMTKKASAGPDAPEVLGTLADISTGSLLSVWLNEEVTDQKVAEFVKISSTN